MASDESDPDKARGYRGYWVFANRPYRGCGCLWVLLTFLLIYLLVLLLLPPPRTDNGRPCGKIVPAGRCGETGRLTVQVPVAFSEARAQPLPDEAGRDTEEL